MITKKPLIATRPTTMDSHYKDGEDAERMKAAVKKAKRDRYLMEVCMIGEGRDEKIPARKLYSETSKPPHNEVALTIDSKDSLNEASQALICELLELDAIQALKGKL